MGDGNCAGYALLQSAGLSNNLQMDLLIRVGNDLYSLNGDDKMCLLGFSDKGDEEDEETAI